MFINYLQSIESIPSEIEKAKTKLAFWIILIYTLFGLTAQGFMFQKDLAHLIPFSILGTLFDLACLYLLLVKKRLNTAASLFTSTSILLFSLSLFFSDSPLFLSAIVIHCVILVVVGFFTAGPRLGLALQAYLLIFSTLFVLLRQTPLDPAILTGIKVEGYETLINILFFASLIFFGFVCLTISTYFWKSEKSLNDQAQFFNLLFEQSVDALFLMDAKSKKLTDCNDRALELFGFQDKLELLASFGKDLELSPLSAAERRQLIERTRQGELWSMDMQYRRFDGLTFWGNLSGSFFSLNEESFFLIRISNVQEKKEAEMAIQQSQEQLMAIVNNQGGPVWLMNSSGQIVIANDAFHRSKEQFEVFLSSLATEEKTAIEQEMKAFWDEKYDKVFATGEIIEDVFDRLGRKNKVMLRPVYHAGIVTAVTVSANDITESLKAREEREQMHFFRETVINNIPNIIYSFDLINKKFLYLSPNASVVLGRSTEWLLEDSSRFTQIVHPDDMHFLKSGERRNLKEESTFELRVLSENNEINWLRITSRPVFDENKQLIRIDGVAQSINKEKEAILELERSNELLKLLNSNAITLFQNPDPVPAIPGLFEELGKQIQAQSIQLFKYSDEQKTLIHLRMGWSCQEGQITINGTPEEVFQVENYEHWLDILKRYEFLTLHESSATAHELAFLHAHKAQTMLAVPWLIGTELGGFICIFCKAERLWRKADTTVMQTLAMYVGTAHELAVKTREIIKNKEKYELAIEASQDGIWEMNLETKETYFSPRWKAIMGYNTDELPNSMEVWGQLVFAEDKKELEDHFREKILKGGQNSYEVEQRYRHKNGQIIVVQNRAIVMRNNKNFVVKIIGSIKDITAEKNQMEQLALAKKEAEVSARAKAQFLSVMSHEIRTPINSVIGLSHLLLEEEPKPQQINYLKNLQISAENLLTLINDILDYTKLESGKVVFEKRDFNLDELLRKIAQIHLPAANAKHLQIVTDIDAGLNQTWEGDSFRLTQIMNNLVSNAIKFTERGKVVVKAKLLDEVGGIARIRVEVSDTGIGIPKDKLDLIFENFTQASSDTTRRFGGTGLGLAISQKLLEMMGSEISVESKINEGSFFSFELKLKNKKAQHVEQGAVAKAADSNSLKGMRILVVDDNPVNLMIAKRFLTKWGADVLEANDGQEAIDIALKNQFHLVLMDLKMPGIDGYKATKVIKASKPTLTVVALTADAFFQEKIDLKTAGFTDFLTKPFQPSDLYKKVQPYLPVSGLFKISE